MSFENLGLSLLALFLQLFVVVITIAVCKAKLLYLGINAALFFLISHTTPSYVPLTWLCFAVALLFVLESLSDTHSVWLDRWKRFSTCVLVLDLVVGNLYDDFFTEAFLFLIPYLALNAAAYLGLLIAAWPIPDPTDPPTDKRTKAWRAVCGGPTRLPTLSEKRNAAAGISGRAEEKAAAFPVVLGKNSGGPAELRKKRRFGQGQEKNSGGWRMVRRTAGCVSVRTEKRRSAAQRASGFCAAGRGKAETA